MISQVLILVGLITAQDRAPSPDVTEEKRATLSDELRDAQMFMRLLEQLGSPRRGDDESHEYFKRIERTFKARAHVLVKLQHYYERALEMKYALHEELEQYDRYLSTKANARKVYDEEVKKYLARLEQEVWELKKQARVVADKLARSLRAELSKAEDATEVERLEKKIKQFDDFALIEEVPEREEIEGKMGLAQLRDREALEEKYQRCTDDIRAKMFERSYARVNIGEFKEIEDQLDRSLVVTMNRARDFLKQPEVAAIELRARQVAIMSEFMIQRLAEVRDLKVSVGLGADLVDVVVKLMNEEPVVQGWLTKLSGPLPDLSDPELGIPILEEIEESEALDESTGSSVGRGAADALPSP